MDIHMEEWPFMAEGITPCVCQTAHLLKPLVVCKFFGRQIIRVAISGVKENPWITILLTVALMAR